MKFQVVFQVRHGVGKVFDINRILHGIQDGVTLGAALEGLRRKIVHCLRGGDPVRDDDEIPESRGSVFLHAETGLQHVGGHIAGLAVAGEAEVRQGVADQRAVVILNRLDPVGMVADNQVRPGVRGHPPEADLVLGGRIVFFPAPVE